MKALPAALNLSDDDFFAPTPNPVLTSQLLESAFVGVALRAPAQVDIGTRQTLPLLVVSRFDGARDWALPFHDHAWLVGIDLGSGRFGLAAAFGSPKRPASVGRGAKPSAEELRTHGAQLSPVDARSRLGVPWQPGCWSFSLVYHDWLSNPVVVRLARPQAGLAKPPDGDACPPESVARVQVDFGQKGSADGASRVKGRVSVAAEAPGAERQMLPVSLLIVTRDRGAPQRHDWTIPVEYRPGERRLAGVIDHPVPATDPPQAGTVAYLVVAGQVHGPRPWGAAKKPVRP
ncbi:MAG: hypothetical protein KF683_10315 [Rubrivivax sp.]|nr:hypothetical protein [Rubrivivax sp.]